MLNAEFTMIHNYIYIYITKICCVRYRRQSRDYTRYLNFTQKVLLNILSIQYHSSKLKLNMAASEEDAGKRLNTKIPYIIMHCIALLPARASEQGNVIGSVRILNIQPFRVEYRYILYSE